MNRHHRPHYNRFTASKTVTTTRINLAPLPIETIESTISTISTTASAASSSTLSLSLGLDQLASLTREQAEQLAGPFFGASLFPYLAFLYFLNTPENDTPKGVTVGFATCLLFVFLTIPAAIAAQVLYGVSLADSDWLHGSAESLLTVTNLVTVVAFRQALKGKEDEIEMNARSASGASSAMPISATSYEPMVKLVGVLTALAGLTAFIPAVLGPEIHTPYLGGFMDLPTDWVTFGNEEPSNALTVACWIIHISSLVEFLVAMGFAWRWADIVDNPKWKGLTWGLIPLHSSGITACTYHLFYNQIPVLVPLQAFLTCVGNTTAAYAAYRIAISNGWKVPYDQLSFLNSDDSHDDDDVSATSTENSVVSEESSSLVGCENLGDVLAVDTEYRSFIKIFPTLAATS